MTLSSDNATAPSAPSRTTTQSFYIAAWRWHFYAGLYVVPFFDHAGGYGPRRGVSRSYRRTRWRENPSNAGLGILLVATGLYLWWPRGNASVMHALVPDLSAGGRTLIKSLHQVVGVWSSVILVAVLVTGMAWAGIWGERFVQAWSTFPAQKWENVPLSVKTHADMNHGAIKDVPWGLEQTPIPAFRFQRRI